MSKSEESVEVLVELMGGTELLFANQRQFRVKLTKNTDKKCNLKTLIDCLKNNHLKERPELFVSGDTVRPGILVLINDIDWELLGQNDYELMANDRILFISTLHGG